MDFNFKFMYKGEKHYWHTAIYADTTEEAIKKAEETIEEDNRKIKRAKLTKTVYSQRKIKEWKLDE